MGELYGNNYDLPWKVVSLSNNLPDPKGIIKYLANMGTIKKAGKLSTLSVKSLLKAKNHATSSEIYTSLNPVGIFIDQRNT